MPVEVMSAKHPLPIGQNNKQTSLAFRDDHVSSLHRCCSNPRPNDSGKEDFVFGLCYGCFQCQLATNQNYLSRQPYLKTHLDCGLHLLVVAQVKRVWQERDRCFHWPSFFPVVPMPCSCRRRFLRRHQSRVFHILVVDEGSSALQESSTVQLLAGTAEVTASWPYWLFPPHKAGDDPCGTTMAAEAPSLKDQANYQTLSSQV